MRAALILIACVLACGCTRHPLDGRVEDRITVCGVLRSQYGTPVSKALLHLYKLPKDTRGDVVANSFELAQSDANGRFVLRSTYAGRQYWLSIERSSGCGGLPLSELESRRTPVTFRRMVGQGRCESTIDAVLDNGCNLRLQ